MKVEASPVLRDYQAEALAAIRRAAARGPGRNRGDRVMANDHGLRWH